jgi:hypothetical protein
MAGCRRALPTTKARSLYAVLDSEPYEERVEEAKADVGSRLHHEKPLTLQLRYNTNDNHQRIAVAILGHVGTDRRQGRAVQRRNRRALRRLRAGDFDVGRAGWLMDYNDAVQHARPARTGIMQDGAMNWGNNYGRYERRVRRTHGPRRPTELDLKAVRANLARCRKDRDGRVRRDPDLLVRVQERRVSEDHRLRANAKDINRTRWLRSRSNQHLNGAARLGSRAAHFIASAARRFRRCLALLAGKVRPICWICLRRVLSAIPIALIAVTVCFFILRLAPGGPFDGERALPPTTLANLRAHYNLDRCR